MVNNEMQSKIKETAQTHYLQYGCGRASPFCDVIWCVVTEGRVFKVWYFNTEKYESFLKAQKSTRIQGNIVKGFLNVISY